MSSELEHAETGRVDVPRIGLGCMNVSHAYGPPLSEERGCELLQAAFEMGYRHFDTATLYGAGSNERLVGMALGSVRHEIFLASKGGMAIVDGKKVIDGRPNTLRRQIDQSLERLQTDHIDLYYLHRVDKSVPIEESLSALSAAKADGKIGAIGLSEVSVRTLTRAVNVASVAAVQNEYSIWTRNCELGVSDFCSSHGIKLVAFSPVCRGFFGIDWSTFVGFPDGDIRRGMPRFQPEAIAANTLLAEQLDALASSVGLSCSQLALAWVLAKGSHVAAVPGTTSIAHLSENYTTAHAEVDAGVIAAVDRIFAPAAIAGNRYPEVTQSEIDTERFPFEKSNA